MKRWLRKDNEEKKEEKREQRRIEDNVCSECHKQAATSYRFCSDCWSFVQYRAEYGTPCSVCGVKMHPSLLKDLKCSGCNANSSSHAKQGDSKTGDDFSDALLKESSVDGQVFVLGSSAYGQIGLGKDCSVPTPLNFKDPVEMIACGLMHSAFVTRAGSLYTFGRNVEGQLGLGDTKERTTPSFVHSVKQGTRIDTLTLGSYHSVYCTTLGELYECGRVSSASSFQLTGHHASLCVAAGNATCTWSSHDRKVWIWGWAGGTGFRNEVKELNGVMIDQLRGNKFEILVIPSHGGRILSIRNEEVATAHLFVTREVSELSHLSGVAELSAGNFISGAITLNGQAISWKRDNSSGAMATLPVQVAPQALSISCGSEMAVIVPQGVWLRKVTYRGRFARVAQGQFHTLILSGTFLGSTTFESDSQSLLFSGLFSDCTIVGVPCHRVFLSAAGIDQLERLEMAFKHAPENLLKAYLLFIYSEKILLDEKSSNALLELLEHSGITNPKRLIQFLKRESMDVSNMSKSLLSMSSGYNVTLQCEDGLIEFHMCLLAMRSKYFAAAGSERWQHGRSRDISLALYPKNAVNVMIRFCCGCHSYDELQLDLDNVCDVLQLANECEMPRLHKICELFLGSQIPLIQNLEELKELAELVSPSLLGIIQQAISKR